MLLEVMRDADVPAQARRNSLTLLADPKYTVLVETSLLNPPRLIWAIAFLDHLRSSQMTGFQLSSLPNNLHPYLKLVSESLVRNRDGSPVFDLNSPANVTFESSFQLNDGKKRATATLLRRPSRSSNSRIEPLSKEVKDFAGSLTPDSAKDSFEIIFSRPQTDYRLHQMRRSITAAIDLRLDFWQAEYDKALRNLVATCSADAHNDRKLVGPLADVPQELRRALTGVVGNQIDLTTARIEKITSEVKLTFTYNKLTFSITPRQLFDW